MRIALFSLALFLGLTATAQILTPVSWTTSAKHIEGDEFELLFTAVLDDGWTLYSQHTAPEDGPVPTSFHFTEGDHYERLGEVKESGGKKKEGIDPFFDVNVIKFVKGPVLFKQRVKVLDYSRPVVGYLEYMTCDDERCLPPTDEEFSFTLQAAVKQIEEKPKKTEKGAPQPTEAPKAKSGQPNDVPNRSAQTEQRPGQDTEPVDKTSEDSPSSLFGDAPTASLSSDEDVAGKLLEPVKWQLDIKQTDGITYELIYTATLEPGWVLYSQHLASDDGPIPTTFVFDEGEHFTLLGETTESGNKKSGHDPVFNMVVDKFVTGPVIFRQSLKVENADEEISGFITYMSCDDEQCIPFDTPFRIHFGLGETLIGDLAGRISQTGVDGEVVEVNHAIPTVRATYQEPLGDCGEEDTTRDSNLMWTFILGFLGGLLALLTPCVFPMIPLTVTFFTKRSQDRQSGIRNASIYGLSIIAIYVSIGLLITAVFGVTALQDLSTNWIANLLFFAIFVFFAFSFFGYYEITLPSSWTNKSDAMADKGGLVGIFFMAFTLALVSFSCTGPIIGTALVESATSTSGPLVVMLGFSSALALPFALFAAFPAWLNSLPRSGSWMTSVKVVLGFLELALALKFLSVADMTMHWDILPYEVFMGLWIAIFGATTLYLLGYIRFPHDSKVKKLSAVRMSFALAFLALTIYLATGLRYSDKLQSYQPLGLLSGIAPPTQYNILLPEPELDPQIKARYASFSKCANNLDCFKDYQEGVAYAKEVGKPLMLDFTGYGCVNCRRTEEHIWVDDRVWTKLKDDFVLVSLYTDDRKKLDQELYSIHQQKKLRTIGNKWQDFQIVNFEQNSQPLYVMMTPDEQVLGAPRGYKEGVKDYVDFLSCGLFTFQRWQQSSRQQQDAPPSGPGSVGSR